jgi:hypothetical protein
MNTQQLRQLINICEERNPDVEYTDTDTQVIAKVESYMSQTYTKLVRLLERTERLEALLKANKEAVKTNTREHVANLFDTIDITKTRIIETKSVVLTLSKDPKPTEAPQYKNILDEIYGELTPELQAKVDLLKKTMVTVTQKSPSLKHKPLDESIVGSFFAKFKNYFLNWGKQYDQKLNRIKQLSAKL